MEVSLLVIGHKTLLPTLKIDLDQHGTKDIMIVVRGVISLQEYDFLMKELESYSAVLGYGT